MKKSWLIIGLAVIMLQGCASENSKDTETERLETSTRHIVDQEGVNDKKLNFQLTREMEEAGMTVDNTAVLKRLSDLIAENPDIGEADQFNFIYSGIDGTVGDKKAMFFYIINKSDEVLKNASFTLNLQVGNSYLVKEMNIELTYEEYGEIEPYTAMPIAIVLENESYELTLEMTESDFFVDISDFKFE